MVSESPAIQLLFSLVAPSQQFSFKLPSTSYFEASEEHSMSSSFFSQSTPLSTHTCSSFLGGFSYIYLYPPTSYAASVCSSIQSGQPKKPLPHGHSFHLKLLTLVSQSGIKAPTQLSCVVHTPHTLSTSHWSIETHRPTLQIRTEGQQPTRSL